MNELQTKSCMANIEVKASAGTSDSLHIKAYALAFNNVDSYGDIIIPSACDAFLKSEDADRMRLCYQHDMTEVIGTITSKGVDENGMWIEADILPTATGKDVQILIKGGALNELSIGYRTDECDYDKDGNRLLKAITIAEVSFVSRAANPKAVLTDVKNEDFNEETLEKLSDEELDNRAKLIENEQYRRMFLNL